MKYFLAKGLAAMQVCTGQRYKVMQHKSFFRNLGLSNTDPSLLLLLIVINCPPASADGSDPRKSQMLIEALMAPLPRER